MAGPGERALETARSSALRDEGKLSEMGVGEDQAGR